MAPRKKRAKVTVGEHVDGQPASVDKGDEMESSDSNAPINPLRSYAVGLSGPATMQDKEENMLMDRRQTYVIHAGAGPAFNRRGTYVIPNTLEKYPDEDDLTSLKCGGFVLNTTEDLCEGTETRHSEREITGTETQERAAIAEETVVQDAKPKKRGRKKKNANMSMPTMQEEPGAAGDAINKPQAEQDQDSKDSFDFPAEDLQKKPAKRGRKKR
ncbi:hypothetical protein FKM82_013737 [Ascaphus truei]